MSMIMSTSNTPIANYLNFVTQEFNRFIPPPLLILGTIGSILNIMVFSRPMLRTNPCSLYFISGSVFNFLSLYVGLVTPFLGLYNLDPTQKWNIVCKLRFYLRFTSITLSTWFILLACIDRFLSTSTNANYRLWSSVRLAKRSICLAIIICLICPYPQVFYCLSINQTNVCGYTTNICKMVGDSILLLCNSGVPPILMVLFSLSTIRNIKHINRMNAGQRRNVELLRILIVQVIVLVLFALPITAQKIYSSATLYMVKSPATMVSDNLISQITTELSYINTSTTFYIYSMASKKFRKEVARILTSCFTCACCKRNAVQAIPVQFKPKQSEMIVILGEHQTRSIISNGD